MASDRCQMPGGKWQMANGKWQVLGKKSSDFQIWRFSNLNKKYKNVKM